MCLWVCRTQESLSYMAVFRTMVAFDTWQSLEETMAIHKLLGDRPSMTNNKAIITRTWTQSDHISNYRFAASTNKILILTDTSLHLMANDHWIPPRYNGNIMQTPCILNKDVNVKFNVGFIHSYPFLLIHRLKVMVSTYIKLEVHIMVIIQFL